MYTDKSKIIESMPQYGVHHLPTSDEETYQSCASDIFDNSCILSVSGATQAQYNSAVSWALKQDKKSYDINFINNKVDDAD